MIPLLELKQVNAEMQADIDAAVLRVARSGRYLLDKEVATFEESWAEYVGTRYCVATGNALDSLRMILMAYEVGPGDEVIVPSNTYIATWLAVTLVGATPVPVEPNPFTHNIDARRCLHAITPRTKAILGVHLYGKCFNATELRRLAESARLLLIEDAAQAHGAMVQVEPTGWRSYGLMKAGNLGHAAAWSFYPSKNLGAMGDAGAVTTNDEWLAKKVRRLRNYGGVGRLDHQVIGINSRMDEMQAAILLAKLTYLDAFNTARRMRAARYAEQLQCVPGLVYPIDLTGLDVWHQFVCQHPQRDALVKMCEEMGLEIHVHYPVPPHLEGAYSSMNKAVGSYPVAERLANMVFSLPIGFNFSQQSVEFILTKVCERLAHEDHTNR